MNPATKERIGRYLEELVKCAEAAGDFYRSCAEVWPEEAPFWQLLAEDELEHAVRLDMIRERVRATPHGVGLLRPYSPPTVQAFIGFLRKECDKVRSGEMTSATALARAKDLEQSLIGSQPLRGFSFDDPRFAPYWMEISHAWERHMRRVTDRAPRTAQEHSLVA